MSALSYQSSGFSAAPLLFVTPLFVVQKKTQGGMLRFEPIASRLS
jgi:hypothetical protein